jgi:hypothetical protein
MTTIAKRPWFLKSRALQSSGCNTTVTTDATGSRTSYSGILFAVQSSATDAFGPTVVSMGFHVDPNLMLSNAFAYEVYALTEEGYYADPNRGDSIMSVLEYDYRVDLGQWTMVAEGSITKDDLYTLEVRCFLVQCSCRLISLLSQHSSLSKFRAPLMKTTSRSQLTMRGHHSPQLLFLQMVVKNRFMSRLSLRG